MRTMEISDDLFKAAEEEAKRRGVSLRELVEGAVATTLRAPPTVPLMGHRVDFPIIRSNVPGKLNITPEMLRQVEFEDDMKRSGLLD